MSATPADPPSPEATADDADVGYAMRLANESYNWYKIAAIRSRRLYKTLEVGVLVISAAIPTSAVLFADNASIPAVLGAVVVVLTGLRSIYHWQENYVRFSQAREAVDGERRGYRTSARPYNDTATRDQELAGAVSRIEQEEMRGWVRIAAEQPKET
jgi:hypothetical protein